MPLPPPDLPRVVLGPFGRASNSVVWPWNVVVVAALWTLLWPRDPSARFDTFVDDMPPKFFARILVAIDGIPQRCIGCGRLDQRGANARAA